MTPNIEEIRESVAFLPHEPRCRALVTDSENLCNCAKKTILDVCEVLDIEL
jgi:hypothetical protein